MKIIKKSITVRMESCNKKCLGLSCKSYFDPSYKVKQLFLERKPKAAFEFKYDFFICSL